MHDDAPDVHVAADNWADRSDELAEWTWTNLVNRTDVWGAYLPLDRREAGKSNNYTAPGRSRRIDGTLTYGTIVCHYQGLDHGRIIGLHGVSRQNTSRWLVVDVDQHGDDDPSGIAQRNLDAAVGWRDALRCLGFRPLLLDSNGKGGFHLLQIFSEPVATIAVFNFARWLVRDFSDRGLQQSPETFPKQDSVNEQRPYGSWWRLPGRHHTRDHWTKVWDGMRWLAGEDAIQALLSTRGDPLGNAPAEAIHYSPGPVRTVPASRAVTVAPNGNSRHSDDHWCELLRGRTPGGRHEALLQLAGHLLGKRVNPAIVEELCVLWNAARNQPPKPEQHIRQTVQDLVRRAESQPARSSTGHHGDGGTIILRPRT